MRTTTIIAGLIFCCCIQSLKAQQIITKRMINPTWVTLVNDPRKEFGNGLYQIKDSSILVSNSKRLTDYKNGHYDISEFYVVDIQSIKITSKSRMRQGTIIGAVSGFVIGGVLAVKSNNRPSESEWALAPIFFPNSLVFAGGAIVGASFGALAGNIVGSSIKIKIPIHGKMDNYNQKKKELSKYAIQNNLWP